ncbi:uncharacterized protein LOC129799500 [Phlebotomus papatasi]|uniref:uncharacterized protein LOC129799500 n=1 Tax=Phlebotomus papatasi TaxID=29031 RepID=UPI0024837DAC|nr:uncharacterized protein LOC129799500 [Phlebotomus papatasi]
MEPISGLSQESHLESIVKNEPEDISDSVTFPETIEGNLQYPSGSHSVSMVKSEPEEGTDNSGENPFGLEKFFVTYVNKSTKPSCSKTSARNRNTDKTDETLSDEENTKLEDCCCKHVQYIYHQLRKNDVGRQKHKSILKKLPLQTKEELEEFDKSLFVQSNKEAFRYIASNLTLKQFLSDDVVLEMKFTGKDSKKGLKDYYFYRIWKEASTSQDFPEIFKAQMRAAKSRQYTAKHKEKLREKQQ